MDANGLDEAVFNSSDGLTDDEGDWDRSLFQTNPIVGKRQAEEIIARQAEDRPLSKRNSRKLAFVTGAPNSQASMLLVARTWDAFCASISHE